MLSNKNKSILITGGTGSFGTSFLKFILSNYKNYKRVVIFSRDELKQFELSKKFPEKKYKNLRYFIGDVRDKNRLNMAFKNIDYVVHAAALKQVPTAEYNPFETIQTNIIGAQNIVEASLNNGVKKVIALSTDKAAAPVNLYGATKLCSDKLFIAANNIKGDKKISFSVVRYGNVMGSRGSVIPEFIRQSKLNNLVTVTDKRMTRFNISLTDSIEMVNWSLNNCVGGEILVPKLPSYKITDLVEAISPKSKIKVIGIRPGEKIHEELITSSDSFQTFDIGKYYIILQNNHQKVLNYYIRKFKCKKVKEGFSYSSGTNSKFLKVSDIKKLIRNNIK
jgi:UDP-N-acetylglucosamine 4,6-dehydratase (inverting)